MLSPDMDQWYRLGDEDRRIYQLLLPSSHRLLDALEFVPWDAFVPELEAFYSPDQGQPAIPPLVLFKLEFLRYLCRLSDREVIARSQSDVLFRWFLQIPVRCKLPNPSLLTRFRGRLGEQGFQRLFERLIDCARKAGVVRDRLRLKDASHVIANIAVPTTLQLLAQLRERMLQAIDAVDPLVVAGFRVSLEQTRQETAAANDAIKLQTRLDLVQDILHWIVQQEPTREVAESQGWQHLQAVRQLAEKIVDDISHPQRGDRTLSVVDPDARRGRHGEYYDGYLLDVLMDADSGLITAVDLLPANADEAKETVRLVQAEQQAHLNQIEQLSIDAIGFNGEMLRAVGELGVDVVTVPRDFPCTEGFSQDRFELSEDGLRVTCPAGQPSSYRNTTYPHTTTYQFKRKVCWSCPLRVQCHPAMTEQSRKGRSITKNAYALEYERVRAKVGTENYRAVRRQHPAIERKLNEILRHQRGRFASYWGRAKVAAQQYMTCFAVNVKHLAHLLKGDPCAANA